MKLLCVIETDIGNIECVADIELIERRRKQFEFGTIRVDIEDDGILTPTYIATSDIKSISYVINGKHKKINCKDTFRKYYDHKTGEVKKIETRPLAEFEETRKAATSIRRKSKWG